MPDFNEMERRQDWPELPDEIQPSPQGRRFATPEELALVASKIEAAEKQIAAMTRAAAREFLGKVDG